MAGFPSRLPGDSCNTSAPAGARFDPAPEHVLEGGMRPLRRSFRRRSLARPPARRETQPVGIPPLPSRASGSPGRPGVSAVRLS